MLVKNDLFDYENRFIYQDSDFFKFSLDSILLAEFSNESLDNKKIIDMCAGNMAIPLILSCYTKSNIVGFEIQKNVYSLGKDSIDLNNLNNRLSIINDDIKNVLNYYDNESFDIAICNPPFFKVNDIGRTNNKVEKSIARHEIMLTLEDIFVVAKKILKNKGCLYMVHRAERLDEIIYYGYINNLNIKKICFVSTKCKEKPTIVLVKAVKNSGKGVKISNELCIQNLKSYINIFKEV